MTVHTGELESYGFEEIEPWVVEDTPENRRRIRQLPEGPWQWERIIEEDGSYTGRLRVISPQVLEQRRMSIYDNRKDILTDPEDPWSDYVGPDDLSLDSDLPYFVRERLARWRRAAHDGVPVEERQPFPARCETVRHDGSRCWSWASNPKKMPRCKPHVGWDMEVQAKNAKYARVRIYELASEAVDALEHLVTSAESEPVRLKAAESVLARIGVRGGTEINLTGEVEVTSDPARQVAERLDALSERLHAAVQAQQEALTAGQDIVEAEVVEP